MAGLLPNIIFDVVRPFSAHAEQPERAFDGYDRGTAAAFRQPVQPHLTGVTGIIEPSWLEGAQYSIRVNTGLDIATGDLLQNLHDFQNRPWLEKEPERVWRVVKCVASIPGFAPYLEVYISR